MKDSRFRKRTFLLAAEAVALQILLFVLLENHISFSWEALTVRLAMSLSAFFLTAAALFCRGRGRRIPAAFLLLSAFMLPFALISGIAGRFPDLPFLAISLFQLLPGVALAWGIRTFGKSAEGPVLQIFIAWLFLAAAPLTGNWQFWAAVCNSVAGETYGELFHLSAIRYPALSDFH